MSFCLYYKKNNTRRLEDMNFIFSWQKTYFTHSLCLFVKYCFATRKKIHIFTPLCNILYVLHTYILYLLNMLTAIRYIMESSAALTKLIIIVICKKQREDNSQSFASINNNSWVMFPNNIKFCQLITLQKLQPII